MSDFIVLRKSRNVLSSAMHVFLNIMLAVSSTFLTLVSGSWLLGVLIVVLSKWRVIAVRPRYWWINFKANMVDLIVGVSLVLLVYYAGMELKPIHIGLTLIYTVWLVWIKPKSSEIMTEIQALFAVFFGMSVATFIGADLNSIVLVAIGFIVGYGASRHVFSQNEDHDFTLLTFLVGIMMAELSWVIYHWLIAYSFNSIAMTLPQLAIIVTLAMFVFMRGYRSALKHDGKIRAGELAPAAIFSSLIVILMVIYFSEPIFNV